MVEEVPQGSLGVASLVFASGFDNLQPSALAKRWEGDPELTRDVLRGEGENQAYPHSTELGQGRIGMNKNLKVSGIDHVVFHVKDLARSKEFYTKLLGMKVRHGSARQVFLQCGTQQIALFELSKEDGEIHGGDEVNHIALRLELGEYQEVKESLEREGVRVSGRRGDPHCIYFSDPDGHRLQLLTPGEQS